MNELVERREARRFNLNLPLLLRFPGEQGASESEATTRNVSFRGLYFVASSVQGADSRIEFILTLPDQMTGAGNLRIRGFARVARTEPQGGQVGVALRIERYEFLAGTE
jgi:PilZ domain